MDHYEATDIQCKIKTRFAGLDLWKDRPYLGQSHTIHGDRGRTEVHGLTMRDISDCALKALVCCSPYYSTHELENDTFCREDIYNVELNDMDPIAFTQNLACEIEKRMKIFPNLPY